MQDVLLQHRLPEDAERLLQLDDIDRCVKRLGLPPFDEPANEEVEEVGRNDDQHLAC